MPTQRIFCVTAISNQWYEETLKVSNLNTFKWSILKDKITSNLEEMVIYNIFCISKISELFKDLV